MIFDSQYLYDHNVLSLVIGTIIGVCLGFQHAKKEQGLLRNAALISQYTLATGIITVLSENAFYTIIGFNGRFLLWWPLIPAFCATVMKTYI